LLEGIKAVLTGYRYFTPLASALLEESFETQREAVKLTRREREVVQMVAEGHSSKEIATRLAIRVKTVENHRQRLMEKLRVHNIAGLTRYAISQGFLISFVATMME
jgi:DNA-binding NarL/FixJ family response regulator